MAASRGIKMCAPVPCGLKGCVELLAKGVSVLAGAPGIRFMGSCGVHCMV